MLKLYKGMINQKIQFQTTSLKLNIEGCATYALWPFLEIFVQKIQLTLAATKFFNFEDHRRGKST